MALPGHALARIQDRDVRLGAAGHRDQLGHGARRSWPTSQRRSSSGSATVADSPIACRPGTMARSRARPSDSRWPRLEVTSECSSSKHDVAQILEEAPRVRCRDQQRQLLGRGEQDVRRLELLALPLVRGRVAGARLQRHRQAHLADRLAEIALDVDGQRLQRRDVERVDAATALRRACASAGRQDRSASAGSRPASCRRRSARSAAPTCPPAPWPAARPGGRAATSRAPRTISRTVRAGSRRRSPGRP